MYSSSLSLTSVLHGVGGQHHGPAALTAGKTRYPLYRRLGGPQGRSGRVRKISPPLGFDLRTVHPVASRYIPTELSRLTIYIYICVCVCVCVCVYVYNLPAHIFSLSESTYLIS